MRRSIYASFCTAIAMIGFLLAAAPSASAAEPVVINVPSEIHSDGSADVGATLTRWLEQAQALLGERPAIIQFAQNGVYRIDDAAVVLDGASNLTLDFRGATLKRTRVIDQHLRYRGRHGFLRLINGPTNVTVRNLNVRGVNTNDGSIEAVADATADGKYWLRDADGKLQTIDNAAGLPAGQYGIYSVALAFEHGIDIVDGVNVLVENSDLRGMGGDGVNTIGMATNGITVRNVTIRRNGRQGIAIVAGTGFLIENNDIMSRRAAIDMEPDRATHVTTDIVIRNNTLRSQLLAFASGGPGEIHNVHIHDNDIYKTGVPVLSVKSSGGLHRRTKYRFENNTVHTALSSSKPLIELGNVHDSVVVGNVIPRTAGSCSQTAVGFTTAPSTSMAVGYNTFDGAAPVVQDVVGGSAWLEAGNVTGTAPSVPLIAGNVLTHQQQDFENSAATCWRATSSGELRPAISRRTGDAYKGSAALQSTVPAGLPAIPLSGLETDIQTTAGRSISASGAVKGLDSTAPVYVIYEFLGADGKQISAAAGTVTGSAIRSWSTFSASSVQTPAGTAKVRLAVGTVSNSTGHRFLFDHLAAKVEVSP